MGLPPPSHDPGAVRDLADRILADPRYDRPGESITDRVIGWLGDQLAKAFGALAGRGRRVDPGVADPARCAGRRRLPPGALRAGVAPVADGADAARGDGGAHPIGGRVAGGGGGAGGARAAGRRGCGAATGRWWPTWSARGAMPDRPGRTAGEYVRDVATALPEAAAPLAAATELFEAAWYGGAVTGAAERDRFVALAGAVGAVRT